jgi:ubiquinone/menaquinone biosynthesis C-methylase UbiE
MTEPLYVCGQSAAEMERLELQGAFYEDITRRFLQTAGVAPGMRVLDIGCGAGDVSLLAADLVGPTGAIVGIDRAAEPLQTAAARASRLGIAHVEFRNVDVQNLTSGEAFDAVIGRFVLMHQADPADVLRACAEHVTRTGLVAFLESHMLASLGVHSWPPSPLYDRIVRAQIEIIRAAGAHVDMGLRLGRTFADAGLPTPQLWLQARVEGGPEAAIYRYMVESLRSMLPHGEHLGVATFSHAELDTLEERLRQEVVAARAVLTSPVVVGAWCRQPVDAVK